MKAFQAYADQCRVTAATPALAAAGFFEKFPNKRKCTVVEGESGDGFFTVSYGRASTGDWPRHWKNVTKKTAGSIT